jgi:SAM-dependent methyltransferase
MLAGPLAGVTFGSIADLGCGSGLLLKGILDYLEERRALRPPALAIDVSAAILRRGTFDSRVTRLRASCENIPLEDSSLSLATCMDVLEHLEYPDRAAREIARVASYCIVKTPLERSFYTLVRGGRRRLARLRSRYGHIHHFDRASLLAILSPHFHILAEDHLPIPDRSRPMAALQRTLLTISPALLYDRLFGGFLVLALRSKHHRTP